MPAMDIKEAREKMIARRFGGVAADSRTGGKGTARRKKKTMHKTASSDDKKIGATLKKLGCTAIPDIQEVNMRGPGVDSARPGRRRSPPARRKRPKNFGKKNTPSPVLGSPRRARSSTSASRASRRPSARTRSS
mmetsp:Transcript_6282/g.19931  ORF Transcript_6282/g.19931 Transcript_6282/m.19931 type:complete len:134 (-) Transcript_6282:357-758(-)